MARRASIRLRGDKAVLRKLKRLRNPLTRQRIVIQAAKDAAPIVESAVLARIPVRTGALRNSITTDAFRAGRSSAGVMVMVSDRAGFFKGDQFYGGFLEFGWTPGKRGARSGGEKVEGLRFMQRGLRASRGRARTRFVKSIVRRITQQLGR